jgi:CBS domain containing-hemolysin-like protein
VTGLLLVLLLVAANGFFVAAEFGLVAARRPTIEERAEAGSRRARAALHELRNISFMLSGAQFGITVTSLLLGFVAQDAFAVLLDPVIALLDLPAGTALGVSLATALAISTVFQMVVGELAPKNLAISRPEKTTLALALAVRAYSILFGPVIRLFDGSANVVTRWLGREPQEELLAGYSPDQLAHVIQASSDEGSLSEEKADLLLAAVELGERRVSEVMVARPDVIWLRADDPIDELRVTARRTGFSRFPVEGTDDDLLGTVHIKDLLALPEDRLGEATVGQLTDDALVVPESYTLRRLLGDLRQRRRTFAAVVDEYGDVAGIVTLEDVLEELVGEIEDEFDPESPALRRLGAGRLVVPGRMRIGRLGQLLGIEVPEGDYETVAGFVIERLGYIPQPGEWLDIDAWRFVVMGVEGNRIIEILLERTRPAAPGEVRETER